MTSLKGETTVYIQKMNDSKIYFKKIFKELIFINITLFIIFLVTIFYLLPSFKSALVFFPPFLAILLFNSLVLIAYRFNICSKVQYDLILRNFINNSRVIKDIEQNYRNKPEINYIIEVLVVGCDLTSSPP